MRVFVCVRVCRAIWALWSIKEFQRTWKERTGLCSETSSRSMTGIRSESHFYYLACVMSLVAVLFHVCVFDWMIFLPDLLCFVSRSYFLGELENRVADPDSLAQLFIKHVSLQTSELQFAGRLQPSHWSQLWLCLKPWALAIQMCFHVADWFVCRCCCRMNSLVTVSSQSWLSA